MKSEERTDIRVQNCNPRPPNSIAKDGVQVSSLITLSYSLLLDLVAKFLHYYKFQEKSYEQKNCC